ncbi:MAG: Lrp/AsnC family transcriptional regulator [Dactylosporangium sp.]|nr:Lrp/AsnC family transcriptional regulator [Dactylosporangium sp.]
MNAANRQDPADLDATDWAILVELQRDGRLPLPELGRLVGCEPPEITERMRRLAATGRITGYRAQVNATRLGFPILAIVRLQHEGAGPVSLDRVLAARHEIQECLWIAAERYHLLRIVASSTYHLDEVVNALARFGRTTTSLVSAVPLPYRGIDRPSATPPRPGGRETLMWASS